MPPTTSSWIFGVVMYMYLGVAVVYLVHVTSHSHRVGLVATIVGTAAPETIRGTSGRDVIAGLGGGDTIRGLAGDDVICGGPGADTVIGGSGDDTVLGGTGVGAGCSGGAGA